jgi:hypothetical protein
LLARADGLPGDETLFIRMLDVIFNRYLTDADARRLVRSDRPQRTGDFERHADKHFYHVFCALVEYLRHEELLP